jgi:hypothetical protein
MSQYQPVSLNTIRAAIMWGGLPTPRLKQVWVFAPPNRPPWSTVHAIFGCIEIQRMCFEDNTPRSEAKAWLRQKLSDCFAQDIQVQVIETTLNGAVIVAMLFCWVEEKDTTPVDEVRINIGHRAKTVIPF